MKFEKIAETTDILPSNRKKIIAYEKEILLANVNGTFYAIDNNCPHMGGSLSEEKLEGANIHCPKHNSIFDLTNGKVVKDGKMLF